MRVALLVSVLTIAVVVSARPVVDQASTVALLSNYVAQSEEGMSGTIVVQWASDSYGHRYAYWIEKRAILRLPDDFASEAVESPALVIREIRFPADVRKSGDSELATSTYLVDESSFRDQLFRIITEGEVIHLKKSIQSPQPTAVNRRG
jgi:hypothetical protein